PRLAGALGPGEVAIQKAVAVVLDVERDVAAVVTEWIELQTERRSTVGRARDEDLARRVSVVSRIDVSVRGNGHVARPHETFRRRREIDGVRPGRTLIIGRARADDGSRRQIAPHDVDAILERTSGEAIDRDPLLV